MARNQISELCTVLLFSTRFSAPRVTIYGDIRIAGLVLYPSLEVMILIWRSRRCLECKVYQCHQKIQYFFIKCIQVKIKALLSKKKRKQNSLFYLLLYFIIKIEFRVQQSFRAEHNEFSYSYVSSVRGWRLFPLSDQYFHRFLGSVSLIMRGIQSTQTILGAVKRA